MASYHTHTLYILLAASILTIFVSAATLSDNQSASQHSHALKILRQSEEDSEGTASSTGGLVLDKCRASEDCADSDLLIFCESVHRGTIGEACSSDYPTCRCIPSFFVDGFQPCTEDADCVDGEVCVVYTPGADGLLTQLEDSENYDFNTPFCASEQAEEALSDIERHPVSGTAPTGSETVIDTTTPLSSSGGLVMDSCRGSDECLQGELLVFCESVNRGAVGAFCDSQTPSCRCIPSDVSGLQGCRNDDDCIVGEVCVTYTPGSKGLLAQIEGDYDFDAPFCASEEAENNLSDLEKHPAPSPDSDSAPTGDASAVDTTTPFSTEGGLSLDPCRDSNECAETHKLVQCKTFLAGNVGNFCEGDVIQCRCVPVVDEFTVCEDDNVCIVGEGCAKYTGESGGLLTQISGLDYTRPFCASIDAVNGLDEAELLTPTASGPTKSPKPSTKPGSGIDISSAEENVCIDARAIRHLSGDELAFKRHVVARVLCDSNDSCATAGHMVTFQDLAMRMSMYCRVPGVKCREDRMHVNSPRYRRGIRIKSRTEGLVFTALAARYETRLEELVLAAAVRLGM